MQLAVQPAGKVLTVQSGDNLLASLRAHGIPVSYSCEDGRCGMCQCRIVRGTVLGSPSPPRSMIGSRMGFILACQSVLADDCAIEVPDSDHVVVHPPRRLRAKVIDIQTLTPNALRLRLRTEGRLSYSPGQFAELKVTPDLARFYSMSGLAEDQELRFDIRIIHGGIASRVFREELKPGASLSLRGPLGASYLRQAPRAPVVIASAGTGLGPALAVLRGLSTMHAHGPVHVYASFMSSSDVYGLEELNERVRQIPSASGPQVVVASGPIDSSMRRGLLTEAIESDLGRLDGWRAYVFGSPHAAEATVQLLRRKGITDNHLYADPFHPTGN